MSELIKLCPREDVETPMIFTFAFIKKELWCPVCGYTAGLFGLTKDAKSTPELTALLDAYSTRAKPYLRYISSLGSGREENEDGELVPIEAEEVEYEYNQIIDIGSQDV